MITYTVMYVAISNLQLHYIDLLQNTYVRRPDEISLISAIKKIVIYMSFRPLCFRHFALKTLAHNSSALISRVMAKLRTPNM